MKSTPVLDYYCGKVVIDYFWSTKQKYGDIQEIIITQWSWFKCPARTVLLVTEINDLGKSIPPMAVTDRR